MSTRASIFYNGYYHLYEETNEAHVCLDISEHVPRCYPYEDPIIPLDDLKEMYIQIGLYLKRRGIGVE